MHLTDIVAVVAGQLQGGDCEFKGISIDSRTLQPGQWFCAVKGENFDGHDFIEQAIEQGAGAVILSQERQLSVPTLQVKDTLQALGQLAQYYRQQFTIPTIALTGSCGKTTTKAMLASILQQCGRVHANQGSFNNAYGLPLTLLSTPQDTEFLVLELGANQPNDIAELTPIAQPTVALLLNAAASHLAGLGSVEGVAKVKGDIFRGLSSEGTAILNRDDAFYDYWLGLVKNKIYLSFGLHSQADVRAQNIQMNDQGQCQFLLLTPQGETSIHLPLLGQHNVSNALAAAAASLAVGIPLADIKAGLESVQPTDKRLVTKRLSHGVNIIDDSYNANPHSMKAAIQLLQQLPGHKLLVMGDMGELGAEAIAYHQAVGEQAKQAGIDKLYAVGPLSQHAAVSFGEGGQHFPDQTTLITQLIQTLSTQKNILVKGSRSSAMEKVVQALLDKDTQLQKVS